LRCAGKIVLDWEAAFAFAPTAQSLASLGQRTLLIHGDESPPPMVELVNALHDFMPGSARVVLPGANHLLPIAQAPVVTECIRSHLRVSSERNMR
jgi:pimeloyl-ACP methyl ester carboxylesterase